MYKSRQSSKKKKLSNNIIKNVNKKALQLLITNNIKKANNIDSFFPFSLIKSRSIVPFSSNTSRNQKYNKLKNSFENLLNNQKSLRNSTIKNKSLINTILNQKSKAKSKPKRRISSVKPKINNMKNTSFFANDKFIKNIVLFRNKNKNKNKNNLIKNKNNLTQNTYILNHSKSRSNSIRCSLNYINRYSYISKHDKPKLKYDNCIYLTSNDKNNNKKNNILDSKRKSFYKNQKWNGLFNKLENLKTKTNCLLNKYYLLTENLYNELEMLNSNHDKNTFVNNKSYDYRKKILMLDKNDEEHYIGNIYINTDINNI